jgi:predicted ATPase
MIKSITLKNFKGHANTSIDLGKITVLAGKNGAGKTSVLQSLHYLSMLASKTCETIFPIGTERGLENLVKRGANDGEISAAGSWGKKNWAANVIFTKSSASESGWKPTLNYRWNDDPWVTCKGTWDSSFSEADEDFKKAIQHTVYLKMVAEKLAEPSVPMDITPTVEYDGFGLASAIANLKNAEPDRFEILEDSLKGLLPFVQRIRVQKKKIEKIEQRIITVDGKSVSYDAPQSLVADELVLDLRGAESLPAHALSEGTLLALGLLTVLVSPSCPNMILLDDIEQGLHPKAQRDIVRLIRNITENSKHPFLQIVMTTHSPYIIDELGASDIWLLNDVPQGTIYASRLLSHPDSEKALQVLTTGELWSSVGEDWVVPDNL